MVSDGENGLLVPPGDPQALAAAIRRLLDDAEPPEPACRCRARLRRLVHGGVRLLADRERARERDPRMRRKLLMVGRTRYALPLSPSLAQKFDALEAELDVRVLGSSGGGSGADPRFHLVGRAWPRALDGAIFYALLPFRVARELRSFRARRGARAGRAGDRARAARTRACSLAVTRDRRRPWRSRRRDPAVRVAVAEGALTARRRPCPRWAAASRRRTHDLRLHVECRARRGPGADGDVRSVHGPRAVPRRASRASARAAGRPLRRRARALQGGRRARRCLAHRRAACPRRDAARGRPGDAPRGSASGSSPTSPGKRAGPRFCRRRRSHERSTERRSSSSRRARRASAA